MFIKTLNVKFSTNAKPLNHRLAKFLLLQIDAFSYISLNKMSQLKPVPATSRESLLVQLKITAWFCL